MGTDEEGTHWRLKAHRADILDPAITGRGGRIVKSTGDGVLGEFPSVVNAVRSAVEIQRGMADRNASIPDREQIIFRIGINLGDVIDDDGDIYGDGVNIAVRLENLADPGGICLSRAVVDHVGGKAGVEFEPVGYRNLKNIAEPISVFRVVLASRAPQPPTAVQNSTGRLHEGSGEVRGWMLQLLECAERAAEQNPAGAQAADSLRALIDWYDEPDADPVEQLVGVSTYLDRLARDAEKQLLTRYFTPVPVAEVIARLRLAGQIQGIIVQNARIDDEDRYATCVRPLLEAIEAALTWLTTESGPVPSPDLDRLRRDLKQLRYLVSSLSFDDQEVDRVRRRIEPFRRSVIYRVTILTQSLLGRHAACLSPGIVFRDGDVAWCPEMVVVPSGSFIMGSPATDDEGSENERPQHNVHFAHRLAVGRYPTTFDEYDHFADANRREPAEDCGWGRGRRPVINVTWEDARSYANWLFEVTGQSYRLLSEAEWEYSCRAGTTSSYSWGANQPSSTQANFDRNAGTTTEVGTYPPNRWGLFDMHGNVWEWVEDCWNDSYEHAPSDGAAWTTGNCEVRVLRGGSWGIVPAYLRSAYRGRYGIGYRNDNRGFRVARSLVPGAAAPS